MKRAKGAAAVGELVRTGTVYVATVEVYDPDACDYSTYDDSPLVDDRGLAGRLLDGLGRPAWSEDVVAEVREVAVYGEA